MIDGLQTFVAFDVETTGLGPDARIVELSGALCEDGQVTRVYHQRINPEIPIPPEASAVHHITDQDVQGCPSFGETFPEFVRHINGFHLVAHNAQFDRQMLRQEMQRTGCRPPEKSGKCLCSLRLARHLLPGLPSHALQSLRYRFEIDQGLTPEERRELEHSAKGDAVVLAKVFSRLCDLAEQDRQIASFDDLLALEKSPILYHHMPFGKYRGKPIERIPIEYIEWALQNMDLDADLRHTFEARLGGAA